MGKVTIPKLEPGESAELQFVVRVVDYEAMNKRCSKAWHIWHRILWRDATPEELQRLSGGSGVKKPHPPKTTKNKIRR